MTQQIKKKYFKTSKMKFIEHNETLIFTVQLFTAATWAHVGFKGNVLVWITSIYLLHTQVVRGVPRGLCFDQQVFHHPCFLCEKTLHTFGLPVTLSTVMLLNSTVYSTVLVFLYMTDVDSSDSQQTNAEMFSLCWSGLRGVSWQQVVPSESWWDAAQVLF